MTPIVRSSKAFRETVQWKVISEASRFGQRAASGRRLFHFSPALSSVFSTQRDWIGL
jgi:hypothetical protein